MTVDEGAAAGHPQQHNPSRDQPGGEPSELSDPLLQPGPEIPAAEDPLPPFSPPSDIELLIRPAALGIVTTGRLVIEPEKQQRTGNCNYTPTFPRLLCKEPSITYCIENATLEVLPPYSMI